MSIFLITALTVIELTQLRPGECRQVPSADSYDIRAGGSSIFSGDASSFLEVKHSHINGRSYTFTTRSDGTKQICAEHLSRRTIIP